MKRTLQLYTLSLALLFTSCKILQQPAVKDACRNCPDVIIDTVETVTYDTLFVVRYDTVVQLDTLWITEVDTLVQTIIDTVFISQTDTVIQADTVWQTDTVYAYEERIVYATRIPDSEKQYYDIHESLRDIDWQIIEDSLGAPTFRVLIYGHTTANRIRYATKCIGYDSLMNAIDERISMTLDPDSTGYVRGESEPYRCHPPGGNAAMNLWLTAETDSTDILHRDYIDVAHIRSIGN